MELTESGLPLYAEARRTLDQVERALYVVRQSVLEAGFAAWAADARPAGGRRF